MPGFKTETYGSGDLTWLGSDHGIAEARTEQVDISAFTAGTHYPDGYIRSGQPVALVGGVLVPYVAAETTTTAAGVLAGFILTDTVADGDRSAPVLDHGRVRVGNLPVTFAAPAAEAKRANVNFVFVA